MLASAGSVTDFSPPLISIETADQELAKKKYVRLAMTEKHESAEQCKNARKQRERSREKSRKYYEKKRKKRAERI